MTTMTNERVALITGGNRGLGLATARRLGRAGVTVVIGARDVDQSRAAVTGLREAGVWASAVPLDVDDDTSARDAAERIRREHGRLDILVNNAGILPEATATDAAGPLDPELFSRTFRTNVLGAAAVTAAVLPLIVRSERGRVVNVSSRMGSLSDQLDPTSPYHALVVPAYQSSKAALNALTIALAKKLAGTPVKVNSVCPGWVQTDLGGPDNRAAAPTTADEAAEVVARAALLDESGPSGSFFDAAGPVPW
ncbi:SDR family NAD(P)-dependent oxidoreductase [Nocardioides kongjuensis]|uniref:NAD(P)-dependent dehydrogenase (Short-subunit alcohol dehydrogenase family) n=1 Tax=Nocardioides kongjuensis TaxID=349522 RepID=A0A852RP92_9ACTN|nr:SDR family NAD(P)-dependent oxidoreductase [Nocardioides kongjuensis]NYD32388.1 NAD(P)-dependent dehydrogenase (short-subunit alcohol dehydrogenase family) [Nocardioides kongjuensis]